MLKPKARAEYIKKVYPFKTQREIAEHCGVTERTIRRDIEKMNLAEGFTWWEEEFFRLMRGPTVSDVVKFKAMVKLMLRYMDWERRRWLRENQPKTMFKVVHR